MIGGFFPNLIFAPGTGQDDLLMETGDHLLLETGDAILLG